MTERLIRAKSGPGGDDPFNLVSLSGLQVFRGDWAAARRERRGGRRGLRPGGCRRLPVMAVARASRWSRRTRAGPTTRGGSPSEGLELAIASGDLALEVYHRQILGFVALSIGDVREADDQLTRPPRAAEASGTRHPGRFKLDGDRLEAALAIGDLERAEAIVAWLEHAGERRADAVDPRDRRPRPRPARRRERRPRRGARRRSSEPSPSTSACRCRSSAPGRCSRSARSIGAGRRSGSPTSGSARRSASFEALGAPLWADRARAELARIGLRPRAPEDLTETERRVAELAATGLSSREIAEQAFLAPKTVGNVLGRVYEKLGIHSRAELGARMGGADRPEGPTRTDRGNRPFRRAAPRTYGQPRWSDHVADTPATRTFLVERYWPGVDEPTARAVVASLERAARR